MELSDRDYVTILTEIFSDLVNAPGIPGSNTPEPL